MARDAYRLTALFIAIVIVNLGIGLLGTLLAVRASIEGFPDSVTGLIMALYYVGLVLGAFYAGGMVSRVGHIRTFAGLASLVSAATLACALVVDPIAWGALRILSGFCMAGIFMVCESWLNEQATSETRGRYLAIYMTLNLASLAASQFMLTTADPAGFHLFSIAAILLSLALVPVVLARIQAPDLPRARRMPMGRLYRTSPLGTMTCFVAGMTIGSFWGIGPIFARRMELDDTGIASFMAAVILGGLALQWPVGWISDRVDRRKVIGGVCILAAAVCIAMGLLPEGSGYFLALAVLLGGTLYPIYSLGVSHVNDFVARGEFVPVSSGLLFLYGCGAALGPILGGAAMDGVGPRGFPFYLAAVLIALVLIALYRMTRRAAPPPEQRESSVALPRTTPLILELDPRSSTPDSFSDD